MVLKGLDDKVVPALAARLRSLIDGVAARRTAISRRVSQSGKRGRLRRLDDRFASTGPLALLRDVPQLGILLVAAVFLVGAGVAFQRNGPSSTRERGQAQAEASLPPTLGPAPGSQVDTYFSDARERAVALSRRSPKDRYVALVSLADQVSPADAATVLEKSKLTSIQAYVRAPIEGGEVITVDASSGSLQDSLDKVFSATAQAKAGEQRELLSQAADLADGDPFKATFETDAKLAGQEAAAYRTPCKCVFALVVEGQAGELAELPALPLVRGVQLAPQGATVDDLTITPVGPDVTDVVPAAELPNS